LRRSVTRTWEPSAPRIMLTSLSTRSPRVDAVDRDDLVSGAHARALRGRALDGRDDRDVVVAIVDLDPDAPEFSLGIALENSVFALGHVGRVRVEPLDHPAQRAVHHLRAIRRIHVLRLDQREHAPHLLEGCVQAAAARRRVGDLGDRRAPRKRGHDEQHAA
jgi:hypothetical protein